jgi:hypothetical protein
MANIEEEKKRLAALDEERLKREQRLEEFRRSRPDAITSLNYSPTFQSDTPSTDTESPNE